jgi:hypothetical protein
VPLQRLADLLDRSRAVDELARARLVLREPCVRRAHALEERTPFRLETIGLCCGRLQAFAAHFVRAIEDERAIRAQRAVRGLGELRDQGGGRPCRRLVGDRGVAEAVADDPVAALERGCDDVLHVIGARSEKKQRLGNGSIGSESTSSRSVSASGVPPGSRVTTTEWPAARSRCAIQGMCVDFPAPSTPSSVMNRPRLLASAIQLVFSHGALCSSSVRENSLVPSPRDDVVERVGLCGRSARAAMRAGERDRRRRQPARV